MPEQHYNLFTKTIESLYLTLISAENSKQIGLIFNNLLVERVLEELNFKMVDSININAKYALFDKLLGALHDRSVVERAIKELDERVKTATRNRNIVLNLNYHIILLILIIKMILKEKKH